MKYLILACLILFVPILVLVIEAFIAMAGPRENFINPERKIRSFGTEGNTVKYMVIGDSTGAGQGADYEEGIAVKTAQHLAKTSKVDMLNTSISGEVIQDLLQDQVKEVETFKPDIIVVSIGANNVTSLTPPWVIKAQLTSLVEQIIATNCDMKIILTASPEMGSVPRLLQPLRLFAGLVTNLVNRIFFSLIASNDLTLAPIARDTGPQFGKDPTLFAEDRYHPNERGYALWVAVLNKALDSARESQPSHCKNER